MGSLLAWRRAGARHTALTTIALFPVRLAGIVVGPLVSALYDQAFQSAGHNLFESEAVCTWLVLVLPITALAGDGLARLVAY
jgi:hypothetical protein